MGTITRFEARSTPDFIQLQSFLIYFHKANQAANMKFTATLAVLSAIGQASAFRYRFCRFTSELKYSLNKH